MPDDAARYAIRAEAPSPETFVALREAAEMAPRPLEAVERGLPNSRYAVTVVSEATGETVGMGRIVGDGATVYHICDMAVHPDYRGRASAPESRPHSGRTSRRPHLRVPT